ncbi:unnamed protein product [Pleuronectes platessa]|uniref:Uncharacterized protein n=1 Tax=Pleuronectes platessa TaxID=8262 RepID=A0A9N7Z8M7_PLEPL|nr:unnamed protein product [Pleuronectes platessa]
MSLLRLNIAESSLERLSFLSPLISSGPSLSLHLSSCPKVCSHTFIIPCQCLVKRGGIRRRRRYRCSSLQKREIHSAEEHELHIPEEEGRRSSHRSSTSKSAVCPVQRPKTA